MKWIDIKDQQPQVGTTVLCLLANGMQQVLTRRLEYGANCYNPQIPYDRLLRIKNSDNKCYLTTHFACFDINNCYHEDYLITHWMPLPEAPKGEKI